MKLKPRRRDPQLGVVTFEQMREIFAQHAQRAGISMLTQQQLADYWVRLEVLEVDADVNPESNPPRAAAPKSRAAGAVHRTRWLDTAMVPASGSASSSAPAGLQLLSPQPGSNTTVPAWSFNGDGALGAGFGCETAVCEVRMLRKTNSGTEATGCTTARF